MVFYLSISEIVEKEDGTSLNRFEKTKLNKAKLFSFFFSTFDYPRGAFKMPCAS